MDLRVRARRSDWYFASIGPSPSSAVPGNSSARVIASSMVVLAPCRVMRQHSVRGVAEDHDGPAMPVQHRPRSEQSQRTGSVERPSRLRPDASPRKRRRPRPARLS